MNYYWTESYENQIRLVAKVQVQKGRMGFLNVEVEDIVYQEKEWKITGDRIKPGYTTTLLKDQVRFGEAALFDYIFRT